MESVNNTAILPAPSTSGWWVPATALPRAIPGRGGATNNAATTMSTAPAARERATATLTKSAPALWSAAVTTALGATGTTAVRSRQSIANGDPGGSGDSAALHVGAALRTGQGRRDNRQQMGELPAKDLRMNPQTAAKMHAQVGSMSSCKEI